MKKIVLLSVVLLVFQIFIEETGHAHPHIFISQKIKVVFDDTGLAGFKMEWEFDDMFTSMITGDYDINRNQVLEENEVKIIKEKAFSYLANSNYFAFIKIDNTVFNVKFVKDFSAKIEKNKLIYNFFIPCHVSAVENQKHIIVSTYDPTYYSAVLFAENESVILSKTGSNKAKFKVKTIVKEDKSTKIYFDMINPMALFLDFKLAE